MKFPAKYLEPLFEKGKRVHLFFCAALLVLTILILALSNKWNYTAGAIFIYLFVIGCIYTGRLICRKWMLNGRWTGLMITVIAGLIGYDALGVAAYIYLFTDHAQLNHVLEAAINVLAGSFVLIFLGFFTAVIRTAIKEKINGLLLAKQNKESELRLLHSQVSPHFLFNTLNNMYSLSVNRPWQMPPLLLKLSELLRYAIYEADQPMVELQDELQYICNYISLESIRSADRLSLTVNLEEVPGSLKIAPMVLIVFVENAFKHARNTLEEQIEIIIQCRIAGGKIYFDIENSCGEEQPESYMERSNSGFGIANVNRRLALLYPGEHELKQIRTANKFRIELCLNAK